MDPLEKMKGKGGSLLISGGVISSTDFIRWFFSHWEKNLEAHGRRCCHRFWYLSTYVSLPVV
jgi:hypothetical protein